MLPPEIGYLTNLYSLYEFKILINRYIYSVTNSTLQQLTTIAIWTALGGSTSTFVNGSACGIMGVTCDTANLTVTGINWSSMGLFGVIPTPIRTLLNLTSLYLFILVKNT